MVITCVTKIPASLPTDCSRPCHLQLTANGRCVIFGTAHGVVIRNLPQEHDFRRKEVETFSNVKRAVLCASQSPNGRTTCAGDEDGNLYLWEMERNEMKQRTFNLDMKYVKITDVAWSPDSRRIAVCGIDRYAKKVAACILVDTGNNIGELSGHEKGGIHSLTYRPCAPYRIVTAGADGNIIFHEGPPFKKVKVCTGHQGRVYCVRYSPDGQQLVSCDANGNVIFWHPTTGEQLRQLSVAQTSDEVEKVTALSIAWSPDSSMIAIACRYAVRVFDVESWQCVEDNISIEENVIGVVWSSKFWICCVGGSGHIMGFRLRTPEEYELTRAQQLAEQLAAAAEESPVHETEEQFDENEPPLISTAEEKSANVDNFHMEDAPSFTWTGPLGYPTAVAADPTSKDLVCGTSQGTVLFLHNDSEGKHSHLTRLPKPVTVKSIVIGYNGIGAVASVDGVIRMFQFSWYDSSETASANDGSVLAVSATNVSQGSSPIHNAAVRWVAQINLNEAPCSLLSIMDSTKLLCICVSGRVVCFDFNEGDSEVMKPLWQTRLDKVIGASITADGTLLAVAVSVPNMEAYAASKGIFAEKAPEAVDATESTHDEDRDKSNTDDQAEDDAEEDGADNEDTEPTSDGQDDGANEGGVETPAKETDVSSATTPTTPILMTKGPGCVIEMYEVDHADSVEGLRLVTSYTWHAGDQVTALTINEEGSLVASADTKLNLYVVETATGKKLKTSNWSGLHRMKITSLHFSPDGLRLASGSLDKDLVVYDIDRPESIQRVREAHQGGVSNVLFMFNNLIVTTGNDASIGVFEVSNPSHELDDL